MRAPGARSEASTPGRTGPPTKPGEHPHYGSTESNYRPERWGSVREPYKFTGKEEDVEVGLAYFGARYLSLGLGQWMSADPITIHKLRSDPNPYAYVMGRPLVAVDPRGEELLTVIAIGALVGAALAAGSNAAVQYATTGRIDARGVVGAALAGAVAGGFGAGLGGLLGGGIIGTSISGVGAGASGGAVSAAVAGGNGWDILVGAGFGALTGLVGSVVGYSTVDWGWLASAGASSTAASGAGLGVQALNGGLSLKEAGIAMVSGVGSGIASAAAMRGFASPPSDMVLDRVGDSNLYKLSDYTIDQLQPMVENWNFERALLGQEPIQLSLRDIRVQFGATPGAAAYTVNDRITLDPSSWANETTTGRVALLSHELTHTVQQSQLGGGAGGMAKFLVRYAGEHDPPASYQLEPEFEHPQLYNIDPLDSYFTYDQTAERVRNIYMEQYVH